MNDKLPALIKSWQPLVIQPKDTFLTQGRTAIIKNIHRKTTNTGEEDVRQKEHCSYPLLMGM